MTQRTVSVLTVGRSDYGIYRPILREIIRRPTLRLRLIVSGAHLSPTFGATFRRIEDDGFRIDDRVEMLLDGQSAVSTAKSIGVGILGFADLFARSRPEVLLVLGDRFETLSAVFAALPFEIPVAHLHGGEASEGAIDESIRHAITKASHLHFVSTEWARDRVLQMGEEPWRVTVTGAPALDNLTDFVALADTELEALIGMPLAVSPLLVTFHPVTLESGDTRSQINELLSALSEAELPIVFTLPNADPGTRKIVDALDGFIKRHSSARLVVDMGIHAYFSLMRKAAAMVGNSSSGIIEAASFRLPVVNVGNRQRGRLHGPNVIDVPCERKAIQEAVREATSAAFRSALDGTVNLYGAGRAASAIVDILEGVALDRRLILKRFHSVAPPA